MDNKLKEKMYYATIGYILSFCNLLLIGTSLQIFGIGLGIVALYFFIKAISIRPDEKR